MNVALYRILGRHRAHLWLEEIEHFLVANQLPIKVFGVVDEEDQNCLDIAPKALLLIAEDGALLAMIDRYDLSLAATVQNSVEKTPSNGLSNPANAPSSSKDANTPSSDRQSDSTNSNYLNNQIIKTNPSLQDQLDFRDSLQKASPSKNEVRDFFANLIQTMFPLSNRPWAQQFLANAQSCYEIEIFEPALTTDHWAILNALIQMLLREVDGIEQSDDGYLTNEEEIPILFENFDEPPYDLASLAEDYCSQLDDLETVALNQGGHWKKISVSSPESLLAFFHSR